MTGTMSATPLAAREFVDRVLQLWAEPIPDPAAAQARFAELYQDPVIINGASMPLSTLVDRAAALHDSLHRDGVEVLDVIATESSVVVAFRMHGTHVGTYRSALGEWPASGRSFAMQVIDILRFHDGRIASIRMVADEAGLLAQLRG
jgi:ketosteroid isomerase-like protein